MVAAQQSPKPNPNRRRIPRQTIANTKPKFANNPPLPGRPFLQKQESHKQNAATPLKIRRRRQIQESAKLNPNRRRIPRQTIANHNPPQIPRPPRRPFLRRQESHSVIYANNGKIHTRSRSPHRPFLRRQESHKQKRQRRYESAANTKITAEILFCCSTIANKHGLN